MLDLTYEELIDFRNAIQNKDEDTMEQFNRELEIVVNRLVSEGWTLPSDLGILGIKRLADIEDIKDVNSFYYQYYTLEDYFHTKFMANYIKNSHIKEGLKKLFGQCWEVFQNKLYIVCAISLVAMIEGILSEFSDDKKSVCMKKVCERKIQTLVDVEDVVFKYTWISYQMFIDKLYKTSDFRKDEPDEINRHWLLHGRSNYKIEEVDCIKLINAVQSLCVIYDTEYGN